MNPNPRIKRLDLTVIDVMCELADGNPGAAQVMCQMVRDVRSIDPHSALGEAGPLFMLDTFGIYGGRIWRLFKNVSDKNMHTTLALLRAVQLGILAEETLHLLIDGDDVPVDIPLILKKVKEQLPDFALSTDQIINIAKREDAA